MHFKNLKNWLRYGLIGASIHAIVTFIILQFSLGCSSEVCINPFLLLIPHVFVFSEAILEQFWKYIDYDSMYPYVYILISIIWGFFIGAMLGRNKEGKKLKSNSKRRQ
ncbi:MAG: hypothetical protein AABX32_05045 [Nanoarchaeota archaeon]